MSREESMEGVVYYTYCPTKQEYVWYSQSKYPSHDTETSTLSVAAKIPAPISGVSPTPQVAPQTKVQAPSASAVEQANALATARSTYVPPPTTWQPSASWLRKRFA